MVPKRNEVVDSLGLRSYDDMITRMVHGSRINDYGKTSSSVVPESLFTV